MTNSNYPHIQSVFLPPVLLYVLMRLFAVFFLMCLASATPIIVLGAEGGLVPCNDGSKCGWSDLLQLGKNILDLFIILAITASALMFAYAGFLFFSDSGSSKNIEKGKQVFKSVVIGLVVVLTAWLIVNTVLDVLTGRGLDERVGEIGFVVPAIDLRHTIV